MAFDGQGGDGHPPHKVVKVANIVPWVSYARVEELQQAHLAKVMLSIYLDGEIVELEFDVVTSVEACWWLSLRNRTT